MRPAPCPRHYGPGRYTLRAFFYPLLCARGHKYVKEHIRAIAGLIISPVLCRAIRKGPGRSGVHREAIGCAVLRPCRESLRVLAPSPAIVGEGVFVHRDAGIHHSGDLASLGKRSFPLGFSLS